MRKHYADTTLQELQKVLQKTTRAIHQKARCLKLKKTLEYKRRLAQENPAFSANQMRFMAGQIPWNKGISYMPSGKSLQYRFAIGHLPHNTHPIGTLALDVYGYLKHKIANPDVWEYVHKRNWIAAHGPIPPGHMIVFKDGNKSNCDIENLEAITRKEMMMRNHNPAWKDYPEELKEVIFLRNTLTKTLRQKREKLVD